VLLPGSRQVEVVDRAEPELAPGEVLVRVRASAICRSDMSLYDGTPIVGGEGAGLGRIVPGHEPAGEIADFAPDVVGRSVGERVAISLAVGCGRCRWCLRGYRMLCPSWKCIGFDLDGGDAEYLAVPDINAMPIPDSMSFEVAAVSTDMIGTQFSTQKRLGVSGTDTVAVFGIGPMGGAGILVAKARGARVIAVDVLESRLGMARQLGADELIDSRSQDAAAELRRLTDGAGVDVAIECSGSPAAQNAALDGARRFGSVAFIGESRSTTFNPSDQIIRKVLTVIGGWYFGRWEYPEVVDFIVRHQLPVERLITHRY
jgi:threonine dehydrogenase-like Zn-dependent dehydrogenase